MVRVPLRVKLWLIVLTAVAVVSAGVGLSRSAPLTSAEWQVAIALLVVIVVIERLDITIPIASETVNVSVGTPLALAGAIYLGVGPGCLVVLTAHILDSVLARRDPLKSLTNIATFVAATATGGWVYWLLAEASQSPIGSMQNLAAAVAASLMFVAVNTLSMATVVAPIIGMPMHELWQSALRLTAVETVTLPAIAGLVSLAAAENAAAVLLLAFPLLGPQVAYRTLARAQQSARDTLESLVDVVEQRDPYTANHSARVANYARQILAELSDVPYQLTATIVTAARVHDIGKVGTRDDTLYKNGPLTPEERKEVLRHAEVGATIVARTEEYRLTASIIRHHHERWDGGGYPDGISGEDIPLGARVICVADSFDAMTTDRPYRKALSADTAIEELRRGSGTQFDPMVVSAFLRAMPSDPIVTGSALEPAMATR